MHIFLAYLRLCFLAEKLRINFMPSTGPPSTDVSVTRN